MMNLLVFIVVYFFLARHVNGTLYVLSDMVEELIGGKEKIEFSPGLCFSGQRNFHPFVLRFDHGLTDGA